MKIINVRIPLLPGSLVFAFASCIASVATTHATIITDRELFESLISVSYMESFESLTPGSVGTAVTLPSGLTATANAPVNEELYAASPGQFLNESVALGAGRISVPGQSPANRGTGLLIELGRPFQAVGFDYFHDFSQGNLNGEFSINLGRGGASGAFELGVPVAQFTAWLTVRNDLPDIPQKAFFGFINDGNPDDLFDPNNPMQSLPGNVGFSNVFDSGFFDRLLLDTFDGSRTGYYDNVTVGFLSATNPMAVPEPATNMLVLVGLFGILLVIRSPSSLRRNKTGSP